MRIDQAAVRCLETRQMNFRDGVRRYGGDIGIGVEAMVGCIDINIIHIEQQLAAGAPGERCDKIPFGNRRVGKRQV